GVDLAPVDTAEVGVDEALVVAPYRLHAARRQWRHDRHHALAIRPERLAGVLVDHLHVVPWHGHAGAAVPRGQRLDPRDAVGHGEDGPAGFRLPVVVDHRPPQAFRDPTGGRLVQWLAG